MFDDGRWSERVLVIASSLYGLRDECMLSEEGVLCKDGSGLSVCM